MSAITTSVSKSFVYPTDKQIPFSRYRFKAITVLASYSYSLVIGLFYKAINCIMTICFLSKYSTRFRELSFYHLERGRGRLYSYFSFKGSLINFALNIPHNLSIKSDDIKNHPEFKRFHEAIKMAKMNIDMSKLKPDWDGVCLGACLYLLEKHLVCGETIEKASSYFENGVLEKGVLAQIVHDAQTDPIWWKDEKKPLSDKVSDFTPTRASSAIEELNLFKKTIRNDLQDLKGKRILRHLSPLAQCFGLNLECETSISNENEKFDDLLHSLTNGTYLIALDSNSKNPGHVMVLKKINNNKIILFDPDRATYLFHQENTFIEDIRKNMKSRGYKNLHIFKSSKS